MVFSFMNSLCWFKVKDSAHPPGGYGRRQIYLTLAISIAYLSEKYKLVAMSGQAVNSKCTTETEHCDNYIAL